MRSSWFRPQVSTTSERAAREQEVRVRDVLYPSPRSCCAMPVAPALPAGIAQDARDPEEAGLIAWLNSDALDWEAIERGDSWTDPEEEQTNG